MPTQTTHFSGQHILLCRPEPEAREWAEQLRLQGARCELLPCLEIQPLALPEAQRQHLLNLDHFDKVIVTSQHAAHHAFEVIDSYWPQLPIQQPWFAIGRKTAQTLVNSGVDAVQAPDKDLTSEQLLALPSLQALAGEKVLLLKGRGGRQEITRVLQARGAQVQALELYERVLPAYSTNHLITLLGQKFDAIVALSAETVGNLARLAAQAEKDLSGIPICVPSERVAKVAIAEGFKLPYVLQKLCTSELAVALQQAPGFASGPTDNNQDTPNRDRD